jgi:hypothetical protein
VPRWRRSDAATKVATMVPSKEEFASPMVQYRSINDAALRDVPIILECIPNQGIV